MGEGSVRVRVETRSPQTRFGTRRIVDVALARVPLREGERDVARAIACASTFTVTVAGAEAPSLALLSWPSVSVFVAPRWVA